MEREEIYDKMSSASIGEKSTTKEYTASFYAAQTSSADRLQVIPEAQQNYYMNGNLHQTVKFHKAHAEQVSKHRDEFRYEKSLRNGKLSSESAPERRQKPSWSAMQQYPGSYEQCYGTYKTPPGDTYFKGHYRQKETPSGSYADNVNFHNTEARTSGIKAAYTSPYRTENPVHNANGNVPLLSKLIMEREEIYDKMSSASIGEKSTTKEYTASFYAAQTSSADRLQVIPEAQQNYYMNGNLHQTVKFHKAHAEQVSKHRDEFRYEKSLRNGKLSSESAPERRQKPSWSAMQQYPGSYEQCYGTYKTPPGDTYFKGHYRQKETPSGSYADNVNFHNTEARTSGIKAAYTSPYRTENPVHNANEYGVSQKKYYDFSAANDDLLRQLAISEIKKHSLDGERGTTLGSIFHIMEMSKKVNMLDKGKFIIDVVKERIDAGQFEHTENWLRLPNQSERYAIEKRRREAIKAQEKEMRNNHAATGPESSRRKRKEEPIYPFVYKKERRN